MIAEQNLKRAIMDSVGLTIRQIIAPPTVMFPEHDAHRHHQRSASKLDEILAEKLDNVRNFKTHVAKMQNAFSIGTASSIPMDEITRIKLLRIAILGHHVMDKLIKGYDHDYPEFLQQTFAGLTISIRTCPTQSRVRRIQKHTASQSNTKANPRATACCP